MTQEEKAQAYDEAIERAKKVHKYSSDIAEIKRMEHIFPELREDEEIREELINYLKYRYNSTTLSGEERECKKWISWLENQGEQKPVPKFNIGDTMRTLQEAKDGWTDGMPFVVSIDSEYYNCNSEKIAIKDQDEYEYPPMNRKYDVCDSCVEQKPAWSEEDEKNLTQCIEAIDACYKWDSMIDWLKSLKERVVPQATKERNKEDEGYNPYKATVESIAEMCKRYDVASHSGLRDFYDNIKVKCKEAIEYDKEYSQKQWKPTKEQMDALLFVVQHYTPNVTDRLAWDSIKILELMHNDLKKL